MVVVFVVVFVLLCRLFVVFCRLFVVFGSLCGSDVQLFAVVCSVLWMFVVFCIKNDENFKKQNSNKKHTDSYNKRRKRTTTIQETYTKQRITKITTNNKE